jgi:putative hydrolase of the HAD superfamily
MFKGINTKAILFDLDDTLYPEREFVISGFKVVSKYLANKYKLKASNILHILVNDFKKGVRGKNFDLLLKKFNLPQEDLKELIVIYRNHEPKIKLYSDAEEIIKYLSKDKKIKIGLISDGPIDVQRNKIKILKLDKLFDVIILSDFFGKRYRKPHPKSFREALTKLDVKPEEAVYVADNLQKDFIGAKKMGIFTIRIKRKEGIYKEVKETISNRADFTFTNLLKLKSLCLKK